jgi:hypothetical protein
MPIELASRISSSVSSATTEIAVGLETLLLVADQVGHERGGHELVVAGATAVEVAVLLEQLERVDRPIRGLGLDDVEVRQQQDRLAYAGAAQASNEIALARRR